MVRNFLRLSRRLFILAMLSGSLVFALNMNPTVAEARGLCCYQCADAEPGCENICNFNPHSPGCTNCQAFLTLCWGTCKDDPNCVPD
jgi:hypothetical protein